VRFALLGWRDAGSLDAAAARLRVPSEVHALSALHLREGPEVAAWLTRLLPLGPDDAPAILALFERCDALRRPQRFGELLLAARLARSALALDEDPTAHWQALLKVVLDADTAAAAQAAQRQGAKGPQVGLAVQRARLAALQTALQVARGGS
jgi:tRNA nucleotidyltransferase (CCA-adding enzyme)